MYALPNSRVRFRDITADDAYLVCRWRNTPSARDVFFSQDVVTPDSHRAFLAQRKAHDLVWIVEAHKQEGSAGCDGDCPFWTPIGMLSLAVDQATRTAEYGRAYLAEEHRGHGYWEKDIEPTLEAFAFDVLRLESIWLEIFADNRRMIDIHLRGGWRFGIPQTIGGDRAIVGMELDAATYRAREDNEPQTCSCSKGNGKVHVHSISVSGVPYSYPVFTKEDWLKGGRVLRSGVASPIRTATGYYSRPSLSAPAMMAAAVTEPERRDWK